jgi:hypothetical protein
VHISEYTNLSEKSSATRWDIEEIGLYIQGSQWTWNTTEKSLLGAKHANVVSNHRIHTSTSQSVLIQKNFWNHDRPAEHIVFEDTSRNFIGDILFGTFLGWSHPNSVFLGSSLRRVLHHDHPNAE